MNPSGVIEQILDLARWAPSGDNVQSWQFEIVSPQQFIIHAADTREHCVYDLDGHPSQIAFGALIETIAIAASAHGLRADVARRQLPASEDARPLFDVTLVADARIQADPLIGAIKTRSVQRRPMRTTPLTAQQKTQLAAAAGPGFTLSWYESAGQRFAAARLMYANARLRLTMPEAYEVHRAIIHWGVSRSPDRVPDQALGVDPATVRLMKWAMVSWPRLARMNTLMGTWAPRLQMDFIPGMACAAHFVIRAAAAPVSIDDYLAAGRALQRFWLTLTSMGLFMQPELTPLIFGRYVREGTPFTKVPALQGLAARLAGQADLLLGGDAARAVYMGRIGSGTAPKARSERRPLDQLMKR